MTKIALVGSAPSSNLLAPYPDESWKIWSCSPDNAKVIPRVDLWFELHGDLGWPEYQSWAEPYVRWLNEQTFPIFAQDQTYIPRAMTFPKDDMLRRFGVYFFTSTFAWALAYAITEGAKEMGIFGIDMSTKEEYAKQRASFHHFLMIAQAKGIKIVAPDESDILQPPALYGYDRATARVRKMLVRKNEIGERINVMRKRRADIDWERATTAGALDEELVARMQKEPLEGHAQIARLEREVKDLDYHIAHLTGAQDDIDYMMSVWCGHADPIDDKRNTQHLKIIASNE